MFGRFYLKLLGIRFVFILGLIITSIVIYSIPSLESVQGFIFLIAGIICLLPGKYFHTFTFYEIASTVASRGNDLNALFHLEIALNLVNGD